MADQPPSRPAPADEFQRARILAATITVAREHELDTITVSRVINRAHVSRRTFYDLFENCGDCLCAAYEDTVERALSYALSAYEAQTRWADRVRAGLRAALEFFDEQPDLARLCFVQATAAGEQTLKSRAKIVRCVAERLDEDYAAERSSRMPSELAGLAIVGGVLEILHSRLIADRGARLSELSRQLMAIIVLPYLGPAAARRELARTIPSPASTRRRIARGAAAQLRPPMRLTYRTLRVLSVISESSGLSNRAIGDLAGIKDQGQMSKLLSRLSELGLIANDGAGQAHGAANAWRLDSAGTQLMQSVGRRSSVDSPGPSRSERVARR
jgi:AcrR family transcriptional regulator